MQVRFMPWAGIDRELAVGPVRFWPFSPFARSKIGDDAVRDHLERYFKMYVEPGNRPVDTVAVCSHGSDDFRDLDKRGDSDVRAAVDMLIFSAICPSNRSGVESNNRSMGPPSADRYVLYSQGFQTGDDRIAVSEGGNLDGGWRIGEISFPKPWCLGGAFPELDQRLLDALGEGTAENFPAEAKSRLVRSLEWFRLAHTDAGNVSVFSKVVMAATALEILLNAQDRRKKAGWMADQIATRCTTTPDQPTPTPDGVRVARRIRQWTTTFYNIRSAVVHGQQVGPAELRVRDWITHLIVADLVMQECVEYELMANHGIDRLSSFDSVHRALGWLQ